jgi:two-component system, chemotaxis family, response regulator WspF
MRIAIVNDMAMAVEVMRRVLPPGCGHELAWVARDGAEAVKRCAQDTPDLVLMDLIMPEMDGVEAIRQIMARTPCAIVVVTASVNQNTSKVFEAMGAGALDAVDTPFLERGGDFVGADAFLGKIKTINRLIRPGPAGRAPLKPRQPVTPLPTPRRKLVAIGASAGGPAALAHVLSELPADFPAPIVVVQHVDARFAESLAAWLGGKTRLSVRLAQEGDRPQPGTVLLAGLDNHLVFLSPGRLGYTSQPIDATYKPSIDVFFRSVERVWRGNAIGVLLTGMGSDGASGLKALHTAGHHTIVQDRATSAVYGMPKAATEMKAASDILPLNLIGPRLRALVGSMIVIHD